MSPVRGRLATAAAARPVLRLLPNPSPLRTRSVGPGAGAGLPSGSPASRTRDLGWSRGRVEKVTLFLKNMFNFNPGIRNIVISA